MTETAVKTEQSASEAPAVVAAAPRTPTIQAGMPDVGEWMQALTERRKDPERFSAVQARIQAATGHILEANVSDWAETPYVGNLIDIAQPAARPFSVAMGIKAAPAGVKSFLRPVLASHLANAATGTEKTDVTDDGLSSDTDQTITMAFIKRAANVSVEAQAFSSPDVYRLVANDLVRAYLLGFEAAVVAAFEGGTYNTTQIAADGSDAIDVFTAAAAAVNTDVYAMPDTLIAAPDVWAKMASFKHSDGRQVFPYLNPSNAAGSGANLGSMSLNVLGLPLNVIPTLSAGKMYLLRREYSEVYESSRVTMGPVADPTVLGTAWGIGGAWGFNQVTAGAVEEISIAAA